MSDIFLSLAEVVVESLGGEVPVGVKRYPAVLARLPSGVVTPVIISEEQALTLKPGDRLYIRLPEEGFWVGLNGTIGVK